MNTEEQIKAAAAKNAAVPNPTELAMIAAALAKEQSAMDEPIRLADDALDLWLACRDALVARANGRRASMTPVPRLIPDEKPTPLDSFLRSALPKLKTKADRLHVLREYLRETIPVLRAIGRSYDKATHDPSQSEIENEAPATLDELEDAIKGMKKKGVRNNAEHLTDRLRAHSEKMAKDGRSSKAKENAEKRWRAKK